MSWNLRHQLIGWQRAFSGTLSRTAVEPRLILQAALLLNAAGVVIGHNHPSGEPAPSREDVAFTRRMDRAGEVVGVKLVDHLVIGNEGGGCRCGRGVDGEYLPTPRHLYNVALAHAHIVAIAGVIQRGAVCPMTVTI